MDTTEIKAILTPLMTIAKAVEQAKAEGKFSMADLGYLVPLLTEVGPAISGAKAAMEEYKSMTEQDRADLTAWCATQFNLASDKVGAKIEAGFAIIIEAGAFFA